MKTTILIAFTIWFTGLNAQISENDFKGADYILIKVEQDPQSAFKNAAIMVTNSGHSITSANDNLLFINANGYCGETKLMINISIIDTSSFVYIKLKGGFDHGSEISIWGTSTKLDGQIKHKGMRGSLIYESWLCLKSIVSNYPKPYKLYFGSTKIESKKQTETDDLYY